MGWTTVDLGLDSQQGKNIFLFYSTSTLALGLTHPFMEWIPGVSSSGLKLPGRKADHLHSAHTP
jgi:hypothetical protein